MARTDSWTRREVIHTGLTTALALAAHRAAFTRETNALGLVVTETAGLRRFGFPVHTVLPGIAPQGRNFRLLRNGRVVPAQFRSVVGPDGRPAMALDFNSSLGPLETERYVVETGPEVESGPEPKRGIQVEHAGASFQVTHGTALTYTIGDRMPGFIESVGNARRAFLQPDSGGLFLRHEGDTRAWGNGGDGPPTMGTIAYQGPLAAVLRFAGNAALPGGRDLAATLDLTFPSSKSWIEAAWRVADPLGSVSGLRVDLRLKLEGESTLVDLGTPATVYGVLRGRDRMVLTAGSAPGLPALDRPWIIQKGPPGALSPFAEAPRRDSPSAEGWAHIMDASRCTALAVADFGRSTRDRIEIEADGHVRIVRDFAVGGSAPGLKGLSFWFHFVPMPVQVGAATSPQAMLAPLAIAWEGPQP